MEIWILILQNATASTYSLYNTLLEYSTGLAISFMNGREETHGNEK